MEERKEKECYSVTELCSNTQWFFCTSLHLYVTVKLRECESHSHWIRWCCEKFMVHGTRPVCPCGTAVLLILCAVPEWLQAQTWAQTSAQVK